MFQINFLFLPAILLGGAVGGEECLCAISNTEIWLTASYSAPAVDVLTAGSCVKQSQYIRMDSWAYIFDTRMKPGYIRLSQHIAYRDCNECTGCDKGCYDKSKRADTIVWGDWSDCSATCGTGSQVRHCHHCPQIPHHIERRTCTMPDCPAWSEWGTCSVTCGHGTQGRQCTQHCTSLQHVTETRICHHGSCPHWTDWGGCSVTCGSGTQSRQCRNYCPDHHRAIETRHCNHGACAAIWSEWGDCSVSCGSGHMRRHCLSNCIGSHANEVQPCNYGPCPSLIQGSAHVCDKMNIIHALAEINAMSATHCPDVWTSKTEHFLMSNCPGIPADTGTWHKGISVAVDCNTTRQISPYTPIGTFWNVTYQQDRLHEGYSGIFIACTQHGFKMATQACSGVPTVIDIPYIPGTYRTDDSKHPNLPSRYFTVRW